MVLCRVAIDLAFKLGVCLGQFADLLSTLNISHFTCSTDGK